MDNLKCFSTHVCDNLNKEDAITSVDLLRKKLSKSLKIAKKFKEELKLVNLEKGNWLLD